VQDPEDDGLYTFATTQIPAGAYQVVFAVSVAAAAAAIAGYSCVAQAEVNGHTTAEVCG
jgi:hypothetical protein